jgi:opacity protein-like surface antigen
MKLKFACFLLVLSCVCANRAHANWQYPGNYLGDGWYSDDGARFIISIRGGAALQRGSISNEIGSMLVDYFINPNDNSIISAAYYDQCIKAGNCALGYPYAGLGDISNLPAGKNLSNFSFAAGTSVGWTVPNSPQWRIELGWDHVSESEYNAAPLFDGTLLLQGGDVPDMSKSVQSGGTHSSITTDVFSVMAFYDFYDGIRKPLKHFIPYIGFGLGYASSETVLSLSDLYGDLSWSVDLQNYGELDSYNVIQFYTAAKDNTNLAGLVSLGFSYGLTDMIFFDVGARLTYLPKVTWILADANATKYRDWYSAKNLIYADIMLGIRFEF